MKKRVSYLLLYSVLLLAVSVASCGKESPPETDPYATLSYDRWVNRYSIGEGAEKINITITVMFGVNKLYTYRQTGVNSGSYEEVPEHTFTETGTYEVTETETNKGSIIFTPDEGTAYTVDWAILPPDGNLFLTFIDGRTVEFDVQRTANN
jgi:hypothetical protein